MQLTPDERTELEELRNMRDVYMAQPIGIIILLVALVASLGLNMYYAVHEDRAATPQVEHGDH